LMTPRGTTTRDHGVHGASFTVPAATDNEPHMRRSHGIPLALLLLVAPPTGYATSPSVFGGRIACTLSTGGVQFCQGSSTRRIEPWEGVPLDVNVPIPSPQTGPFPLIVDLHGWSLGKTATPYVDWARAGYVVLSYTARGFHASCGTSASRLPDAT